MKIEKSVSVSVENAINRIVNGYPIERESDFQSVFFGELYKELPNAIIRLEHTLKGDYQSYIGKGKELKTRKSRVDINVEFDNVITVIELKYLQGAGKSVKADMLADIAKVERIIEANEAHEGFCIQLVKPGVINRLPVGPIEIGKRQLSISSFNYNFEIKGQYHITPHIEVDDYVIILHYIESKC